MSVFVTYPRAGDGNLASDQGEQGAVVGTSGGDDSSSKDDASKGGAASSSNLEVKFLNSQENRPKK